MQKRDELTSGDILNKVSRSFALCVPLLDENKIKEVENQYLLARFVDTIEDSKHLLEDKIELTYSFLGILNSESNNGLDNLLKNLKEKTIDEHDKVFIDNFNLVLKNFRSFDDPVKNISFECLKEMGSGMLFFQQNQIETFDDLDEYCYYVAGTVGIYLTDLVKLKDNVQLDIGDAIGFGRYLQKVNIINIIKDFLKDLKEGRIYWPAELHSGIDLTNLVSKPELKDKRLGILEKIITNAIEEKKSAFDYIISIPEEIKGYRKFCQVCAIMATETLKEMKGNDSVFLREDGVKISKDSLFKMLDLVKSGFYTNDRLRVYISGKR